MSRLATTQTRCREERPMGNWRGKRSLEANDPAIFSTRSFKKLWGMLVRKERWGLSWGGRLLVTALVVVGGYVMIVNIHPFLAVTHRVNANVLVVEGWVSRYAINAAAAEFRNGSYERIFTTGGPVEGSGGYVNDYQTSASVGADLLKKVGVTDESLQMVPSHVIGRDRTYSSASALRDWFRDHNVTVNKINLLTEDCHARRSRLLYEKAFGKKVSVGIISVCNPDYDPKHWWRSSDGVREVISESIAYLYARFFFYLSTSPGTEKTAKISQAATKSHLVGNAYGDMKSRHQEQIVAKADAFPPQKNAIQ